MVSPELLRRFSFFGGLTMEHIVAMATAAQELTVEAGAFFFHEEDLLNHCFLLLEGDAVIVIEILEKDREAVVNDIAVGELFGLSALVPPYYATASARAQGSCRVVAFDCASLRQQCQDDAVFGSIIHLRVAQVLRDRLRDLRVESLASSFEG
ncbi:MAG: cyclic nucleotide-binding domain-containing protein [Chloroflexaceae bacterium]|nr:cyclic nucleotide-binding domain-containing protein [Chloroflexaceae bacterium]